MSELDKQLLHTHFVDLGRFCQHINRSYFKQYDGWWTCYVYGSHFPGGIFAERDERRLLSEFENVIAEIEAAQAVPGITIVDNAGPALATKAIDSGFRDKHETVAMVLRPGSLRPIAATDLTISQIDSVDSNAKWETLDEIRGQAFGVSREALSADDLSLLARHGLITAFLGQQGERPVTTIVLTSLNGFGSISNLATLPEHRGRGYGGAMMTHAIQHAFANGVDVVGLEAEPGAVSLYERLGFHRVATYTTYSRPLDPALR